VFLQTKDGKKMYFEEGVCPDLPALSGADWFHLLKEHVLSEATAANSRVQEMVASMFSITVTFRREPQFVHIDLERDTLGEPVRQLQVPTLTQKHH
jgi:hypothetical protein